MDRTKHGLNATQNDRFALPAFDKALNGLLFSCGHCLHVKNKMQLIWKSSSLEDNLQEKTEILYLILEKN